MHPNQVPRHVRAHMELVAGCQGQEAVDMWLTCREQFTGDDGIKKGQTYPRYLYRHHDGQIVPTLAKIHTNSSVARLFRYATPAEALAHVVEKLREDGRV